MIPKSPGVYLFKDSHNNVLYVGKAINLYHRVASYFREKGLPEKTKILISKIAKTQTIVVESELEALILEANLIKKFLPPFNIKLTDDKDYLYIAITKEDFPKVITVRRKDLKFIKKYWGPFPSSRTVRDTLKSLRKVFPWCSNPISASRASQTTSGRFNRQRPCFYYHLGLCPGACAGAVKKDEYNKIIRRFIKFLDGKKEELISDLLKEMNDAAKKMNYEKAGKIKKTVQGVEYLTQPNRTKLYLENPNFLEKEKELALMELKKDLRLAVLPERIEGYDISNIAGKEATGSMVVLTHGEIDKSQYRRFKINPPAGGSGRPNDIGMMSEMVKRRLGHKEWKMPDLIIVDGGRGQARAAKFEIRNVFQTAFGRAKSEIPIFGLAKRLEWLYPPEGEILKLPKKSLSLKLLQKLRDEAHRFALFYHRKLRDTINLR